MRILGISAFYHDSAAALLENGEVIAAAQEERFTRKKHDPGFPVNAVRFCLEYAGISVNQLDAIVFYDKPLLKFERLLETYYAYAPKGLSSFMMSMPIWIKEKLFLKKLIRKRPSFSSRNTTFLMPPAHSTLRAMNQQPFLPSMEWGNGQQLPFAKEKGIR
jgi:predicted NodU family carbamoyl transferase